MFRSEQQIGSYTLIKSIGKGGFGEVWLAEKRSQLVNKRVAVKLPLEVQVNFDAIRQEATLWEQASGHPNVLPIIDADIYDGQVVIVSEYADGGSLSDKLGKEGKLSIEQALEMTVGILKGLEFLHSKQIIHRDIKPQNVLLQGNTPRLADFGISRVMNTSKISSVVVGTDGYMSPEAFDGKRNVQTDIWSVGVLLYELLIGRLPFSQEHPTERMFAILTKDFTPMPDEIPQDLQEIIQKTLSKKPEERFQTASQMRKTLQETLLHLQHPTFASTKIFDKSTTAKFSSKENLPKAENITRQSETELKTEAVAIDRINKSDIAKTEKIDSESIHTAKTQVDLTSSKIPLTEIQFNDESLGKKTKKNNYLSLSLAGLFTALIVIALIVVVGLGLYFSIGSLNGENPVVIKLSDNKLLLNDAEMSKDKIADEIKKLMTNRSSNEKLIYISAEDHTMYNKIVEAFKYAREANVDNFGLMLSDEEILNATKVKFPYGSDSAKLKFFYQMPTEIYRDPERLNIYIGSDNDFKLNDQSYDEYALASYVELVFKSRKDKKIYKQGTKNIDTTVFVKSYYSAKYADILRVLRRLEKAGASPINLQTDDVETSKNPDSIEEFNSGQEF